MHLGIFAKTFPRPTVEETLDAVVSHGLTHVQFNMSCLGLATLPDRLDEDSCVWISQQLRERGLTMAAISGTFNMCDPSSSRLENNLRRLDVLAAACRWLDTRIITLCTGSRDRADMWKWNIGNVTRESWDVLVAAMKAAVKIADRHEVTLAFEPEIHNVVSSVMRARRLLDEIGSPWLKVVIDPANLIYSGGFGRLQETLDEAFEWLGPDMVLAHAKEPQLADLDETVLTKLGYETMSRLIHAEAPAMNAGDAGDEGPEQLAQRMADHARFTQKLSLAFFYPYFQWLTKIGYRGAIIIHGLEESAVDEQSWFLRKLLNYRSQEGPNE